MDLQTIKTLLDFVGRSGVSELTVSEAGTTVVIRNSPQGNAVASVPAAKEPRTVAPVEASQDDRIVRVAIAGVLHRAPTPGGAPLIAVGDVVEPGQALCIVEAMKVFTTVSAPHGGTVRRIFFEDGQDVGFGDPLVEIC